MMKETKETKTLTDQEIRKQYDAAVPFSTIVRRSGLSKSEVCKALNRTSPYSPKPMDAPSSSYTSGIESLNRYKATYAATRSHSAAIRSGYGWNKWAMENAKAVGNL